jgi:hypothetical protein
VDVLTKPLEVRDLLRVVDRHCREKVSPEGP